MSEPTDALPARARHGKAKRYHYVPEMMLWRLAGLNLRLWLFDKRQFVSVEAKSGIFEA